MEAGLSRPTIHAVAAKSVSIATHSDPFISIEFGPVMVSPIVPATPAYDANGTPYSPHYGDIYHGADSGPGQARHVFSAVTTCRGGGPGRANRDATQSRVEFFP
jgi:hypothetical protein